MGVHPEKVVTIDITVHCIKEESQTYQKQGEGFIRPLYAKRIDKRPVKVMDFP